MTRSTEYLRDCFNYILTHSTFFVRDEKKTGKKNTSMGFIDISTYSPRVLVRFIDEVKGTPGT